MANQKFSDFTNQAPGASTYVVGYDGATNVRMLASDIGGGGIIGIADATGTYTYYTNLNTAIASATVGQVVELFADIEETSAVSVNLRGGVDINFNGHSYTLNETTGVPNVFNTSSMSDGDVVHMWNGKINRIGSTTFSTGTGFDENRILSNTVSEIVIHWNDCILECDNGGHIYASQGSFYGGTYVNYYNTGTASWGLIHTSTGGTAYFYDLRMYSKRIMCLKNYGGKLYNCRFYNEYFIGCGLYNAAAEMHDCHISSDGHSCIIGSNGLIVNTYCKNTGNQSAIDFGSKIINCIALSQNAIAIKAAYSSSEVLDSTGYSVNNYGLSINSGGAKIRNITAKSDVASGALVSTTVYGGYFEGGASGDALIAFGSVPRIFGATLVLRNTSGTRYCIGVLGSPSSQNAWYANNTFISATATITTPVNPLIVNNQTSTPDSFGNCIGDT